MKELEWKIHTPNLLKEIAGNSGQGIYSQPLRIFSAKLCEVAERAREINDPILNHLMCQLTLYTIADPEHIDYDKNKLNHVKILSKKISKIQSLKKWSRQCLKERLK